MLYEIDTNEQHNADEEEVEKGIVSTRAQGLHNHLPGRFDRTILLTEPTFPEDYSDVP